MLTAYVDESERDDTHYFLGALICTREAADQLTAALDGLMEKHAAQFPKLRGAELHGYEIMAGRREWRAVPLRVRFAIYTEAMAIIGRSPVRVYIEGVDIVKQAARGYPTLTPARELAFSHLFERINSCCTEDEPRVKVIADEHHTADISRSNFNRYKIAGTYGYRSSKLPLIDPQIDFIASHISRPLQASDLVTYMWNRVMTVEETDERATRKKAQMWDALGDCASWPRGRTRIWP